MKKIAALVLALVLCLTAAAALADGIAKENIKLGIITLHDEQSTYDKNFIDSARRAAANLGLRETGRRVVICGGGLTGCECALQLAHEGREVTIVDAKSEEELCRESPIRELLFRLLDETGVRRLYGAHVTSFTEEGVKMVYEGEEKLLECDTAIGSFGLKALDGVVESLRRVVAETYVVGDAYSVGQIAEANMTAFDAAVEI